MKHLLVLSDEEARNISLFFHDVESENLELPEAFETLWFAITETLENKS